MSHLKALKCTKLDFWCLSFCLFVRLCLRCSLTLSLARYNFCYIFFFFGLPFWVFHTVYCQMKSNQILYYCAHWKVDQRAGFLSMSASMSMSVENLCSAESWSISLGYCVFNNWQKIPRFKYSFLENWRNSVLGHEDDPVKSFTK